MPNEAKENSRLPIQEVLTHVLDMMKHMISDPNGIIPESYVGVFDEVTEDTEGNPMIQTLGGMILTLPEALEEGKIYFSPNLGVDPEGLCSEVCNLCKYIQTTGYELLIATAHYIDAEGQVTYGQEARNVKSHIEQAVLLQKIKHMQENMDSTKPRLILPDSKIITR